MFVVVQEMLLAKILEIPKNEKCREQWLNFIRKFKTDDKTIKLRSIVCTEHFTADCFKKYNNTNLLKEFSVPSISVSRLKSAKINVPEVKFMLLKPATTEITEPKTVKTYDFEIDGVQPIDCVSDELQSSFNTLKNSSTESIILDHEPSPFSIGCPIQKVVSRDLFSKAAILCDSDTPKKTFFKKNNFSPAYRFVRDEFNCVLPCPRTLSKWYVHVDAEPGFTKEAIDTLSLVCKNSSTTIYCSLLMDEISIRKHVEWDGFTYHGYNNFGSEIQNETMEEATECFVLMAVGVNASWKIPVGYFLCNHLNSTQKVNLIRRCIDVVSETDANPANIITSFNVHDHNVNVVFDAAHMIKLIRNTFGEKKILIDHNGGVINFNFIEKLLFLQENEKCHLDALLFCKDNLKLDEFKDCEATIHFIRIMNDAFDILNSRNLVPYGFKGAVYRGLGNCMALEDIPILNCSSVTDPIMAINNSNCTLNKDINLEAEQYNFENDGLHLNFELSEFSKEVSVYIAGFVSHKFVKDKGGLTYPSDDVIKICVTTE
ncbi:Reverse transcriptase domain-containing protein, partial [Aphis craccivora]